MAGWFVGQKVVCVDDCWSSPNAGYGDERRPGKGIVYIIREIEVCHDGGVLVRLVEIVNEVRDYAEGSKEFAFRVRRFRPVVEFKNDISELIALLDKLPSREVIDA